MFALMFGGRRKGSRNHRRSTRRRGSRHRRGAGRRKSFPVGSEKGRYVMTHKGWRVKPGSRKRGGRRRGSHSRRRRSGRRAGRPRGSSSRRRSHRRRSHRRRGSRRRSMIARMLGLGNRFGSFGSGRADSLMQAMGPFPSS